MTTDALRDRPKTVGDAEAVVALFHAAHAGGFVIPPTIEQVRAVPARSEARCEHVVVDETERVVGAWILLVHDGWLAELRAILTAVPRRGIGRYAMSAELREAFEVRGVHRVYGEVVDGNAASQALCAAFGFVHQGTMRDGFRAPDGSFRDLRHYGLLARERRDG